MFCLSRPPGLSKSVHVLYIQVQSLPVLIGYRKVQCLFDCLFVCIAGFWLCRGTVGQLWIGSYSRSLTLTDVDQQHFWLYYIQLYLKVSTVYKSDISL